MNRAHKNNLITNNCNNSTDSGTNMRIRIGSNSEHDVKFATPLASIGVRVATIERFTIRVPKSLIPVPQKLTEWTRKIQPGDDLIQK